MRDTIFPLSRTPADYRMPERISLRAIGQIIKFEWRMTALYAAIGMAIGIAYCLVTPKQYEATVQVVPGDFTTRAIPTATSGLASVFLNTTTENSPVKRFVTVLYSPDLARQLASGKAPASLYAPPNPGWFSRLFAFSQPATVDYDHKVRWFEGQLSAISFTEAKQTFATTFSYRAEKPERAVAFLKLAVKEGDDILRQYNLQEIRYDDSYLSNTIGVSQNIDVRQVLAQKLVETKLRQMDAKRSEFFSIRTIGPVEISEGPVWPRTKVVTVGMLVLGGMIGLIMAFVRVYVRNGRNVDVAA